MFLLGGLLMEVGGKYALVGSHGVGKTTLISDIEVGLPKIQETARDIIQAIGKLPQDMAHEELCDFQQRVYDEQRKREGELPSFVSDRSIYDNLAYLKTIDEDLFATLLAKEKAEGNKYDKIFYIPIEFPLESDGLRYENDKFQKTIDTTIKEILTELGISYETITGTREERKYAVERSINERVKVA